MRFEKKQLFASFIMPMILLAIRIEMEVIFKMNFPLFMENSSNQETTMRLANGVITEVLDPSMYYSRLSFLESGKEAIDIKHRLGSKSSIAANNGFKLPNNKNKYYTRSALVKNLIPNPSEGRVRALFNEQSTKQSTFARIGQSTILSQNRSPRGNIHDSRFGRISYSQQQPYTNNRS